MIDLMKHAAVETKRERAADRSGSRGRFRFGSFKQGVCREKCLHAGAVFQYNTSKMDGRRTRPGRPFYLGARSKRRRFYF
ncbi:hypothetical protein A0V43_12040 [Geobacillus sp. JS12]|nr:hypothetical protein A0V43_12040 [Geobacillus sp. JS12]